MNLEEVVKKFLEYPLRMNMGAGKLSKRYKCSREDIYEARKLAKQHINNTGANGRFPNILVFDIETAPVKAYVWKMWKENISLGQIISDWFMLSWSAKWLYDNTIMSDKLTSKEARLEDDKRIVENLHKLLDKADIVIAHNGNKFDIPKMNARFIINGLGPVSPYRQIDTMLVAKHQFGFTSNSLNGLATFFGFETKLSTSFDLWKRCMEGDKQALDYMEEYNKYDVQLLEDVYIKLRPWIKSHPNVAVYMESDKRLCSHCGSSNISPKGNHTTNTGIYKTYKCKSCGGFSRERINSYDKEKKKALLASTPR